jgi:uncharacterized membrane protein
MTATEQTDVKDMVNLCTTLYICNIIAALTQFNLYTSAFGIVVALCILIFAYIKRAELKETLFESHFHWMIRSFWIGGSVYLPIVTIIGTAYFLYSADLSKVVEASMEGEKDQTYLMALLYESNAELLYNMMFVTVSLFAIWWTWRMLRGLLFIRKQQPVTKVNSWL